MSELKVRGVVTEILPEEVGVSVAGKDWKKQEFVIETEGQYPKNICFTLFGDKTDLLSTISHGMTVDVSFNVESREHNGRWFHNINAWKIISANNNVPVNGTDEDNPLKQGEGTDEDLPF